MSLISQVFDHHHDTASNEHSTTELGTARSNDVILRKKLGAMKSYSNDTFNRGSTAPILLTIFSSFNPASVPSKTALRWYKARPNLFELIREREALHSRLLNVSLL